MGTFERSIADASAGFIVRNNLCDLDQRFDALTERADDLRTLGLHWPSHAALEESAQLKRHGESEHQDREGNYGVGSSTLYSSCDV